MKRRLPRPEGCEYNTTASTVVARNWHWCEEYRTEHRIAPGERYARFVAFPGHDVVSTTWFDTLTGRTLRARPQVMRLCEQHVTQYDRPMPPTRAEHRKAAR